MRGKTILIVEDERDLVDLIKFNLERANFNVLTVFDGEEALSQARLHSPDLILLDLMIPKLNGHDVTGALKRDHSTRDIPIIMLTARSQESDIVVGLQLGADDYVTKPFSLKVLLACVTAVLRRSMTPPDSSEVLRAGPISIDRGCHVVSIHDEPIVVTLTEFRLLEALAAARSRVLTRDQLVDRALGRGVAVTDRTIDVHVTSLRRKLGDQRDLIETVRGVGYRFADVWQADEMDD